MNLQIFTSANRYINRAELILAFILMFVFATPAHAWEIDLSRRQKDMRKKEATVTNKDPSVVDTITKVLDIEPVQEVVILNTESGFVPSTVNLRKDGSYTIHVVNVSEKEKNVSFILDQFGQYHGTFYGKKVSFKLKPDKEGIYAYHCPETSAEGRLVVVGTLQSRGLSSDEKK